MVRIARISLGVALGLVVGVGMMAGLIFAYTGGDAFKAIGPGRAVISALSSAPLGILPDTPAALRASEAEVSDQPAAIVAAPSHALAPVQSPVTSTPGQLLGYEETLTEVYDRVLPSVVGVLARADNTGSPVPEGGAGSGFIVDASGLVLTNNHVVSQVESAVIRLSNGNEYDATVTGRDISNDLALLAIEDPPANLKPAELGDSSTVRVGQVAITIGSPFGLQGSLTAGVVSSLDRTRVGATSRPMRDMIQTDADINPGNSGGPLLNSHGEVIGINTIIQSPVRGSVGVGFSVPINSARRVLRKLETGQEIKYPWLGISGLPLNNRLAEELGVNIESGIYIIRVVAGGPADQAGLHGDTASRRASQPAKDGDVIVEIDGRRVTSINEVGSFIDRLDVGDEVELTIVRDGKEMTLTVELGEWPELRTS